MSGAVFRIEECKVFRARSGALRLSSSSLKAQVPKL
jgi:hypothetical protein